MTNKILCAVLAAFFFSCPSFGASSDTYTTGDMVLTKPGKASLNWDGKVNGNFDIIVSSVAIKASSQTFTGQNTFSNKTGFFVAPSAAYGVAIATTATISGKLTTTVAFSILDWTYSGYTSSIWGVHNGSTSGDDGFAIISDGNSWNGRLDLGSIYGPQLHGKGAIGAPLLGLNNSTPAYAFDVTGGGRFTSTMTASAYYGNGATLTGVATSSQLTSTAAALSSEIARATAREDAIAVSTGVLQGDLATEVSRATLRENDLGVSTGTIYAALNSTAAALTSEIDRATARENAIAVSTGALEASKVNRAGDTMSGQLTTSSSMTAAGGFVGNLTGNAATATTATNFSGSLAGDVTGTQGATVVGDNSHLHGAGSLTGIRASTDTLGGDVTGTYTASVVGDDSHAHSATTLTGIIQSTATGNYLIRVATATYLATAPGACTEGQYISGLTADGTKTCGTPSGGGDAVIAATQTFTGQNTFTSDTTLSGGVVGNTTFETTTATTTFSGWIDIGRVIVSSGPTTGAIVKAACPSGFSVSGCGAYCNTGSSEVNAMYADTAATCTTACPGAVGNFSQAICVRIK